MDEPGVIPQSCLVSMMLEVSAVSLRLQSGNREDVLRELVRLIPDLRGRTGEQIVLWQALSDREKLHTTAVGGGLAFPHARNAMGNILRKPVVVIGRHDTGVDWDAPDKLPVRLFALMAAPNLTEHLHLLGRMSRILRNAETRERLLKAASESEAVDLLKSAASDKAG